MSVQRRKDNKGRVLKTGESQRKDGSYMYRYTDIYGNRKSTYAPDLNTLREKEDEIQRALNDGIVFQSTNITVVELFENFLGLKQNIRETTKLTYTNVLSCLKKHAFGKARISQVKTADAKMFVVALSKEGKMTSTICTYKNTIKLAFDMACENELILKNPFSFSVQSVLKSNSCKKQALTKKQVDALLSFMCKDKKYSRHLDEFKILLGTGLRISELYGLTVDDIDFLNKRISVNHQLIWLPGKGNGNIPIVRPPKTEAGNRIIPMSDEVEQCFKKVLKERECELPSPAIDGYTDFVFLTNHKPRDPVNLQHTFRRIKKAFNKKHPDEPLPQITPHILRHTFCTNMIYCGMNIKSVQYLMGHSSIDITLRIYAHATKENVFEDFAKAMERQKDNCVYVDFAV